MRIGPPALVALLAAACSDAPPRPARPADTPDKAALYGDPGLIPTREGERIRAEVAVAGEIATAALVLADVDQAHANVERGPIVRAVVTVRAGAPADPEAVRAQVEAIARGVLGPKAQVAVVVSAATEPGPTDDAPTRLPIPLMLGLLGFGVSVGVLGERAARRRAAQRRRAEA